MEEQTATQNEERPAQKRLLLHTCCGPCSTYVATALLDEDFAVTGYFLNPNIQPFAEHERRREAAEQWSREAGVPLLVEEGYRLEQWMTAVAADIINRCEMCYGVRLLPTAQNAREKGFEYFSTTLLISPYQKHEQVQEVGEAAAAATGVSFLYKDFRPWFRQTHDLSRKLNLYRQNYCGCIFSDYERAQRRPPHSR